MTKTHNMEEPKDPTATLIILIGTTAIIIHAIIKSLQWHQIYTQHLY